MSTSAPTSDRPDLLANRFELEGGTAMLTGVQAVGRLLVEIHARDASNGQTTASLISGYPGSPLGGLDRVIAKVPRGREHGIHLVPGLNEELAMTSVWGSQIEPAGRARNVDGVVGVWYGKAPGLDRCSDALRHANLLGANPAGGALLMVGDDPACKSSTIPSASESLLAALSVPVLYPRNSAEVVSMGLQAVALSRLTGCFVALKIAAEVADGFSAVSPGLGALDIVIPALEWDGAPWSYQQRTVPAPPGNILSEGELAGPRLELVRRFARANELNRIELSSPADTLGIVAPGRTYDELLAALATFGLDADRLETAKVRLLRVGMPFPLEPEIVREFATGLTDILVLEEKGPFIEGQLRDVLYGGVDTPVIVGKRTTDGRPLVPAHGELTSAVLMAPLRAALRGRVELRSEPVPRLQLDLTPVRRTPFFCSGCPHNRSTVAPEGSVVGGGIGCHSMVALIDRPSSAAESITQMGGEGAQFIGQAPFLTERAHLIQNLGDGTLAHSGQLAIQACVAADVNVTFKILFNHVVAMTGGQDAEGARDVPSLTRKFEAEGVKRTIVVSRAPRSYGRRARWAKNVDVWDRDRLDEAQRALQKVDGVTVLIYDQECAAELRRLRKRGQRETPTTRIVINDRVCEGCGDCGAKSNCLSVQPIETPYGRKTTIDQTSCNFDYSCIDGECPSFVKVEVSTQQQAQADEPPPSPVPRLPAIPEQGSYNLFLAGVGGTGIVTVNQVLATAALSDDLVPRGVDQTGLSQKAGPVTSHLRLGRSAQDFSNRPALGEVDCFLAFDVIVGSDPIYLRYLGPDRTATIVSTSITPTGAMVSNPQLSTGLDGVQLGTAIASLGTDSRSVQIDSIEASNHLFGEETFANMVLLGAGFQAGAIPISAEAIEWAIDANGVAVDKNLAAFRWGRAAVTDRPAFDRATNSPEPVAADDRLERQAESLLARRGFPAELNEVLQPLVADLIGFQSSALATEYLDVVQRAFDAERAVASGHPYATAVAKGYHHLLAYKDEYEVARLLTDPAFTQRLAQEVPNGSHPRFLLHPPVLRALGMKKKISIDARLSWGLRGLAKMRTLRGTPLDPFGYTHIRRLERRLAAHYKTTVDKLSATLTEQGYETAVQAATAAQLVRGYEEVKLAGVQRYTARLIELGLQSPVEPSVTAGAK